MSRYTQHLILSSPQATAALAVRLGSVLRAGDTLLLEGPIGAGKTLFARSLIQSRLIVPEDVPSPTFTLVQTYMAPEYEIWHADLYRLGHPQDVVELGLTDAFDTAICLVEWPDRLGQLAPQTALTLRFSTIDDENVRVLDAAWSDPTWTARLKDVFHD